MRVTEICVLGGGPAGSTIARQLARLGHEVLLVEKQAFPRPHVGESLSAGILPLLEALELRPAVEAAGLLRPHRVQLRWGPPAEPAPEDFTATGYQVDRGLFDQLLLEAARAAGVVVWQPARAHRPRYAAGRWRIPIECAGQLTELRARYLVDATGRRPVVAGSRPRFAAPTLALHGQWQGCALATEPTTYLEAAPTHWLWGGPLPGGTFSAAVFLDARQYGAGGRAALDATYRRLLARSELLRPCLAGQLQAPVAACDATPAYAACPVDATCLRVGDANFSVDPLATQGVQNALAGALQGSIVVHTLLTQPANQAAALAFYTERQQEAVRQHRRTAARYYAEPTQWQQLPFWQNRAGGATPVVAAAPPGDLPGPHALVQRAPQSELRDMPCLRGNSVVYQRGLMHPCLPRPVAYWADIELAPLLELLPTAMPVAEVIRCWAAHVPLASALALFRWLWNQAVIVSSTC
jgi:flavin-dependent dehydrogenase